MQEFLPVIILSIPLPCVLSVKNNREQAVRLSLIRRVVQDALNEIISGVFTAEILICESDFVRQFSIAEDDDNRVHFIAIPINAVWIEFRLIGWFRTRENFFIRSYPANSIAPEYRNNLLRNRAFPRPHSRWRLSEFFFVIFNSLHNLSIRVLWIVKAVGQGVIRLTHLCKVRVKNERENRMKEGRCRNFYLSLVTRRMVH